MAGLNKFVRTHMEIDDVKKRYLDMGLSEAEASARAEMDIYGKERYKLPSCSIKGEETKNKTIIKLSFNDKRDAEEFLTIFKRIDTENMAIEGIDVVNFIRNSNKKSLGGVSTAEKLEQIALNRMSGEEIANHLTEEEQEKYDKSMTRDFGRSK